jgi:tetratricopeptide (TPR) repeat protein
MRTLATLAWRAGDYARATTFQQQFFDHAREAADVLEIARGYGFLGILAYEQEQHERATQLLDASREALSNLGVREELAWVVGHCARAARARGEPLQAKQLFIESLELFQQLGVYWGIAECLVGVAGLEAESGQRRRAAQLFGRAAALREEYGLRLLRRDAQLQAQQLAVVREALGDAQFEVAWEMGRRQALETTLATLLTGAVKEKPRPRVSPAGAAPHPS